MSSHKFDAGSRQRASQGSHWWCSLHSATSGSSGSYRPRASAFPSAASTSRTTKARLLGRTSQARAWSISCISRPARVVIGSTPNSRIIGKRPPPSACHVVRTTSSRSAARASCKPSTSWRPYRWIPRHCRQSSIWNLSGTVQRPPRLTSSRKSMHSPTCSSTTTGGDHSSTPPRSSTLISSVAPCRVRNCGCAICLASRATYPLAGGSGNSTVVRASPASMDRLTSMRSMARAEFEAWRTVAADTSPSASSHRR